MPCGDRLSDLPDDLLLRILYLLPVKDVASTGALGRRWRSSGAVNLDSRNYDHVGRYEKRRVILRDAREALAAASLYVAKLTFRYMEGEGDHPNVYLSPSFCNEVYKAKCAMAKGLAALLSTRAARRLEELRIGLFYGLRSDTTLSPGLYHLSLGTLPSSTSLRVLHISRCLDYDRVVDNPFPRLVELRLHLCSVSLDILQGMIDTAPLLAALHLEKSELFLQGNPRLQRRLAMRCPGVTTLVLAEFDCWGNKGENTMELEAPLLRRFTYEGPVRSLSLKPPQPQWDMTSVHLRLHFPGPLLPNAVDETCHKFVRNFSNAKILKVNYLCFGEETQIHDKDSSKVIESISDAVENASTSLDNPMTTTTAVKTSHQHDGIIRIQDASGMGLSALQQQLAPPAKRSRSN